MSLIFFDGFDYLLYPPGTLKKIWDGLDDYRLQIARKSEDEDEYLGDDLSWLE
jgi:hypothetical protein